jgi:AcrR family transcriptional regulator
LSTQDPNQHRLTLDRVISVAAELFAERGYRATTLDDVADALHVKKASLYHYIDTKNSLLQAIYHQIVERIADQVLPLAALELPADERLRRMVQAHVEFVSAERGLLSVVFGEEWELPAEMRESIRQIKRGYEQTFQAVVREGQEQGVLREGSPALMVLALMGMTNWMHTWFDPRRYDRREIIGEFVQLLERGWLASDVPARLAWPRADSVESALADSFALLSTLCDTATALRTELAHVKDHLADGVMNS